MPFAKQRRRSERRSFLHLFLQLRSSGGVWGGGGWVLDLGLWDEGLGLGIDV